MRQILTAVVYIVMVIGGGFSCLWFFENSARPHTIIAVAGGFLFVIGVYMFWVDYIRPEQA